MKNYRRLYVLCMSMVILSILGVGVLPQILLASMDDAQAMTKAFKTYGQQAAIEKVRKFGDTNWTYRIGFYSPKCLYPITWTGEGLTSWDNAFNNIPPSKIPVEKKGTVNLQADSGTTSDPNATQAFVAKRFQFMIDAADVGVSLPITATTLPWSVNMNFDSTTITDGYHVVCGKLSDTEGSFGGVPATMLKIKQ